MNILIVYESYFGNTEQIARAMYEAVSRETDQPGTVRILHASEANPEGLAGVELLMIGSPTRGFRPTEATVAFLKRITSGGLKGVKVAAFDTRIHLPTIESKALRWIVNTGGYAAKHISGSLQKLGGELIAPPEGFLVMGEQGPLKEGELERAAKWASSLV